MTLLLAAPVGAASPWVTPPRSGLDPHGTRQAVRDVIVGKPDAASARISASATRNRYPLNDGSPATVAVAVTASCQESCTDPDPARIASFLGTLLHGPEIELLTVQLDASFEIEFDCGYGAQACYYPSQNKIVLSGNDTPARDGASRAMVLAHEYGHHVGHHRSNPAPFPQPLEWGTARWSSYERVCKQRRAGKLFPGDGGIHYYEDPGEAFAEAFARYHFRNADVRWKWIGSLRPDARAFEAIREDTLRPWSGRRRIRLIGRVPPRRRGATIRSFRTPLDGMVSLRPVRVPPRRYEISLRNPAGRVLRAPRAGLRYDKQLRFTVCGQKRLRVVLRARHRSSSAFGILIQRP